MTQIFTASGKLYIALDDSYSIVSSCLHNKIELHKDDAFIKDFTNVYAAFDYYMGLED